MSKKLMKVIITLFGGILGFVVAYAIDQLGLLDFTTNNIIKTAIYAFGIIIFIGIFNFLAPKMLSFISRATKSAELELKEVPLSDIAFGTFGLIIGLILAFLISQPIYRIQLPYIGNIVAVILSIILYIGLGYLGIRVSLNNKEEITNSFSKIKLNPKDKEKTYTKNKDILSVKVLDTSVIIDGRIKDIMESGFIEGRLLIPVFVLEEIQHIADSDNSLRRQKGRRGLDMLKAMQNSSKGLIEITNERYDDIAEVDSKLVAMAKDLNAKILTNDYNLNKVADVQDIEVLSINELANAMKPIVIPGEEMTVTIIKDGKESNQGLAYLDDGTMIVVEDGKNYIGKEVETIVTSVLQTAAGKMIFVKIKKIKN